MDKSWYTSDSAPGTDHASAGYQPLMENPPAYYPPPPHQHQPMGAQPHQPMGEQPHPPMSYQGGYPYLQGPYAPSQPTVIQVVSQPMPAFGSRPANTRCPFCLEDITTHVKQRHTASTHCAAFGLSFFCCCCMPYWCKCFDDVEHECPNCSKFLGVNNQRIGRPY